MLVKRADGQHLFNKDSQLGVWEIISTVASHPFLGFRLTRELENFRWYHVLGPHLGHTARVDVDFRSGAHLFYGVMS